MAFYIETMAKLGMRVRLLGWGVNRWMNVDTMTTRQLERARREDETPSAAVSLVMGKSLPGITPEMRTFKGPKSEVTLRFYRPTRPVAKGTKRPVVLYFHGGGFTLGSVTRGDWLCSRIADEVDAVVVSVGYRLAPEHPFPAALDDCYAATLWVVDNAKALDIDGERVAVMGDSAGGNLAAEVCLDARDKNGPPIRHQTLIYPATDLTMKSASIEEKAHAPFLTKGNVQTFLAHYLSGADPTDPRASPLLAANHANLPPALIQVAEHDPIRDDGTRYAAALRKAGNQVRYTEYVGMPHGYISLPAVAASARQALAEIVREQRAALASVA